MRTELAAFTFVVVAATPTGFSQTALQPAAGPTFDVVSIKRSATDRVGPLVGSQSPDGGFTMTNVPVGTLIARVSAHRPCRHKWPACLGHERTLRRQRHVRAVNTDAR